MMMLASPLTRRLFLSFVAVLLVFALLSGVLTAVLGSRAVRQNYERTLLDRARSTAAALASANSPFSEEANGLPRPRGQMHGRGMMRGTMHGGDLQFLGQLLQTNVWILDRQGEQITIGTGGAPVDYRDLPADARSIVEQVFAGQEVTSSDFSSLLGDASLTAGVPIPDLSGNTVAALLLHDHIDGMDAFLTDAVSVLLAATGLGVLAVLLLSGVFARRFSKPLLQMSAVTRRLAQGETGITTNIVQKDEVGALAADIDTLSDKLREAKERETELEQLRRDFSTKLSHELKTPVSVMRGSLEALRDGVIDDPEEIRQSYDILCAESRQLDRLISDMLELTALQNPQYRLNMESLDLQDVLNDAIRSQRALAREKETEIKLVTKEPSLPFTGDYGRLRQMFITVLNNAVKYSPNGAVIQVNQDRPEGIRIKITNPSPPLPADVLENLFTQFYRAEEAGSGFGLGLSIAQEIAQRHAIRIEVQSDESTGTHVTFHFPEA